MIYPRWLQLLSRADFLKSVGLYVTPHRLFLVRLRKDLFRLSIIEEESREIPITDSAASRRLALSEALRSLLRHFDTVNDPLYICLSPHQSLGFQLLLPQVAEENLPQVIEYEIERQVPFGRGDLYYDFLPMARRGDKIAVFLFGAAKRELDEILETLATFGVKPKGVEVTTTALANYLFFCTPGATGPIVVLGGQDQAWEMIGLDAAGNGWGQSAEILFSHWLPQAKWIEGAGKELFHECLRRSPKAFGWGYLQDFLSSVDGESLQVADLLALGKARMGVSRGLSHSFFIPAVGAALGGLREATFNVNLLPGGHSAGEGRAISSLNAVLAVALLVGMVIWGLSYPIRDEIRLRQVQRENEKLGASLEALRREEDEFNRLREEIGFLSALRDRRGEVLRVMDELSQIVPSSAYLSNLRYRDEAVDLQGSAESASNLIPVLERSPLFKNVGFNAPSNRGRDNRETFSLKAELERPEPKGFKP